MGKPVQDPDFDCSESAALAAILPLTGDYYTVVARNGSVSRLHRLRPIDIEAMTA